MLRELMSLLSARQPLSDIGEKFAEMLDLTGDSVREAGEIFFSPSPLDPEAEQRVRIRDIQVNKLQRKIRRRVVAHLSLDMTRADVPYCLLLMSLVKDVERLGDYAKNLAGIRELHPAPLPDDDIVRGLKEVHEWVTADYKRLSGVIGNMDQQRASALIVEGRALSRRLDAMINATVEHDYSNRTAAVLVLAIRFYKRIVGHVVNLLTGVVQPIHKLDYYDED